MVFYEYFLSKIWAQISLCISSIKNWTHVSLSQAWLTWRQISLVQISSYFFFLSIIFYFSCSLSYQLSLSPKNLQDRMAIPTSFAKAWSLNLLELQGFKIFNLYLWWILSLRSFLDLLKLPQSLSLQTNLHSLKAASSPITSCLLKNCSRDSIRKTQLGGVSGLQCSLWTSPALLFAWSCSITTTYFSFLVEGEATNKFSSGCGLRQGDPLLPLLFNLLMENLSQGFHLAERMGKLESYKMVGVNPISHFLFADDGLCFTKANAKSPHAIKEIIHDFSTFSGL